MAGARIPRAERQGRHASGPDRRRSIDRIRDYLRGEGYPDPLSNAAHLTFLEFFYLVDGIDAENRASARFRWSIWAKGLSGESLVRFLADPVFAFFAGLDGKPQRCGLCARLSAAKARALNSGTCFGNGVDPTRVRLARMTLTRRGFPDLRMPLRNVSQILDIS